jgi:PAS domain-containing protein
MTPKWCTDLLDAMIEAVCLVDATTLRITAANRELVALVGIELSEFVGKPVIELTAAPEDLYFWEDVASGHA